LVMVKPAFVMAAMLATTSMTASMRRAMLVAVRATSREIVNRLAPFSAGNMSDWIGCVALYQVGLRGRAISIPASLYGS
jgi:hypothetical protein